MATRVSHGLWDGTPDLDEEDERWLCPFLSGRAVACGTAILFQAELKFSSSHSTSGLGGSIKLSIFEGFSSVEGRVWRLLPYLRGVFEMKVITRAGGDAKT